MKYLHIVIIGFLIIHLIGVTVDASCSEKCGCPNCEKNKDVCKEEVKPPPLKLLCCCGRQVGRPIEQQKIRCKCGDSKTCKGKQILHGVTKVNNQRPKPRIYPAKQMHPENIHRKASTCATSSPSSSSCPTETTHKAVSHSHTHSAPSQSCTPKASSQGSGLLSGLSTYKNQLIKLLSGMDKNFSSFLPKNLFITGVSASCYDEPSEDPCSPNFGNKNCPFKQMTCRKTEPIIIRCPNARKVSNKVDSSIDVPCPHKAKPKTRSFTGLYKELMANTDSKTLKELNQGRYHCGRMEGQIKEKIVTPSRPSCGADAKEINYYCGRKPVSYKKEEPCQTNEPKPFKTVSYYRGEPKEEIKPCKTISYQCKPEMKNGHEMCTAPGKIVSYFCKGDNPHTPLKTESYFCPEPKQSHYAINRETPLKTESYFCAPEPKKSSIREEPKVCKVVSYFEKDGRIYEDQCKADMTPSKTVTYFCGEQECKKDEDEPICLPCTNQFCERDKCCPKECSDFCKLLSLFKGISFKQPCQEQEQEASCKHEEVPCKKVSYFCKGKPKPCLRLVNQNTDEEQELYISPTDTPCGNCDESDQKYTLPPMKCQSPKKYKVFTYKCATGKATECPPICNKPKQYKIFKYNCGKEPRECPIPCGATLERI